MEERGDTLGPYRPSPLGQILGRCRARCSQLRDRDEKACGAAELLLPNCKAVAFHRQSRVERIQQQNSRSSGTNSKAKAFHALTGQWARSAQHPGVTRPQLRPVPTTAGHPQVPRRHPYQVQGIERHNDSKPGCSHRVVQCNSVLSRLSYGDE